MNFDEPDEDGDEDLTDGTDHSGIQVVLTRRDSDDRGAVILTYQDRSESGQDFVTTAAALRDLLGAALRTWTRTKIGRRMLAAYGGRISVEDLIPMLADPALVPSLREHLGKHGLSSLSVTLLRPEAIARDWASDDDLMVAGKGDEG